MNSVIIYTFGHIEIFKSVLQALAVLFDPAVTDFFVSNDGMGLGVGATLAAMIAFIGSGLNWFETQKFTPYAALYGMTLYALLFVPKMNEVWVTDLYTGRTEVVNQVPLGVSLIGYAYSTIAVGLTRNFEIQYTTPGTLDSMTYSGNLASNGAVASGGFLSPLKTMLHFRYDSFEYLPTYVRYNIISYTRDCIHKADIKNTSVAKFNAKEFTQSVNPFDYLFDPDFINAPQNVETLQVDGSRYHNNCGDLRNELAGAGANSVLGQLSNSPFYGMYAYKAISVQGNFDKHLAGIQNSLPISTADSIGIVESELSALMKSGVNAQNFMVSALARDIAKYTKLYEGTSNEVVIDYARVMSETVENGKMLQAVEGEEYLYWSMAAMSALQFLFYALSPIVGLAMVSKGPNAFKYLGGYLLFGFWVYSWLPVASAINFWSIGGFMEAFNAQDGVIQITPETVDMYIDQGQQAVAVGSNLLAMTPLITFAILSTGGAYAMTSLAQAANPSGGAKAAAANLTPNLLKTADVASMSSQKVQSASGTNFVTSANSMKEAENSSISFSKELAKTSSSAQALVTSAGHNLRAATTQASGELHNFVEGIGSSNTISKSNTLGVDLESGVNSALSSVGATTNALSGTEKDQFALDLATGNAKGIATKLNAARGFTKESGKTTSQSEVDSALQAFNDGIKISDSSNTTGGTQEQREAKNSLASAYDEKAQASDMYDKTKRFDKENREQSQLANKNSATTAKTYGDFIRNFANAGVGTSPDMLATAKKALSRSMDEAGIPMNQQNKLQELFDTTQQAKFNNGRFKAGNDADAGSALVTAIESFGSMKGDNPLETTAIRGAISELLGMSGNNSLTPNKSIESDLMSKEDFKKDGNALVAKVEAGSAGVKDAIDSGRAELNSGAKFNAETEMKDLYAGAKNLDESFNAATGQTGSTKYSDLLNAQLDKVSQNKFNVNDFDDLSRNDARTAATIAAQNTAAAFTEDAKTHNANNTGRKVGNFNDGVISNNEQQFQQYAGNTLDQGFEKKQKGSIASNAFSNIAGNFKEFSESTLRNQTAIDSQQAATNNRSESIRSTAMEGIGKDDDYMGNLVNGNGGVPGNTSQGFINKYNENLKADQKNGTHSADALADAEFNSIIDQQSRERKNDIGSAVTAITDYVSPDAANALRGALSGTADTQNQHVKDVYNSYREDGHSPAVAYAKTAELTGGSIGGNIEGLYSNLVATGVVQDAATGNIVATATDILTGGVTDKIATLAKFGEIGHAAAQHDNLLNNRNAETQRDISRGAASYIENTANRMIANGDLAGAEAALNRLDLSLGYDGVETEKGFSSSAYTYSTDDSGNGKITLASSFANRIENRDNASESMQLMEGAYKTSAANK